MRDRAKTYEMLWDCAYCGSRGLLGLSHRFCPSCGAPQDPGARYFPNEEQKVAVEDHRYVGADRRCPSCESPNSAAAAFCGSCGAPMTGAESVARQADQRRDLARGMPAGPWRGGVDRGPAGGASPAAVTGSRTWRRARPLLLVTGLLGVVLLGLLALGWTREATVEVLDRGWERGIEIERYGQVQRSGWCDGLPADARVIDRQMAQRGTRQVPDGQECGLRRQDQGDGTFTESMECRPRYRDEAVMARRCSYLVHRWSAARTETASGGGSGVAPHWPRPRLAREGLCDGCERAAGRYERYWVRLSEPGSPDRQRCELSQERWSRLRPGTRYAARVRVLTGGLDCADLRPLER